MTNSNRPSLSDWALVRVTTVDDSEFVAYHLTGKCHSHPFLQECAQIVTTAVRELDKDGKWAMTQSRLYDLLRQLDQKEFTAELAAEAKGILYQELGFEFDVVWISLRDFPVPMSGKGSVDDRKRSPSEAALDQTEGTSDSNHESNG